ncbi:MAG: hypothetical protein SCK28_12795, partial [Bacillota bacterium]|nr:hypothetical protein [Bacillota bacterium]
MTKLQTIACIKQSQVIAIIRGLTEADILWTVPQLIAGGIRAVEVTLNTPGALQIIKMLQKSYGSTEVAIGAGTVINKEQAEEAIAAGAQFLISPHAAL